MLILISVLHQIQVYQDECSPGSDHCGKNFGIAVRSGAREGTDDPETRKEVQIVIRQEGEQPMVLKCQELETYPVTANEAMTEFIVSKHKNSYDIDK